MSASMGRAAATTGRPAKDEKASKAGGSQKSPDPKDNKSRDTKKQSNLDTKKQSTLDNAFKQVVFEDEERFRDLKAKVMEEVVKVRQERAEIEKLKVELKAREVDLLEKLENLETPFQELVERDKDREARLNVLEGRVLGGPKEGDTVSEGVGLFVMRNMREDM